MATVTPTRQDVSPSGDGSAILITWTPVDTGDTCVAVSLPKHNDVSVQGIGTFSGSTLTVEGSNDGTNFIGLRDPTQTAISMTAADIRAILEHTRYVRPVLAGGSASDLTVAMLFCFTNPNRT